MTAPNYSIVELAELGGVSRRTVRYYVQERLLPPPLGFGRGRHYGVEHLDRLVQVKAMQERGLTLEEIRDTLAGPAKTGALRKALAPIDRSAWIRIELVDGLELHVSSSYRIPTATKLGQLAEWCREAFKPREE